MILVLLVSVSAMLALYVVLCAYLWKNHNDAPTYEVTAVSPNPLDYQYDVVMNQIQDEIKKQEQQDLREEVSSKVEKIATSSPTLDEPTIPEESAKDSYPLPENKSIFHGVPYCLHCKHKMTAKGLGNPMNQSGGFSYMLFYVCSSCGTRTTVISGTRNGEGKHHAFWSGPQ